MVNIGICDDNKIYLEYLEQLLKTQYNDYDNITFNTLTPSELASLIKAESCPYDIILTDIDMGEFNGIDLAKKINKVNPSCIIIFISNYINYATEVYEATHIYFVIKSDVEKRLPKALEKAFSVLHSRHSKYYTFRFQNIDYKISLEDITHIEALGRYLYIHDNKNSYKCIKSLKTTLNDLSDDFVRCHNSYIVNMNYIQSISRTGCVLTNNMNLPISMTYWKSFQASYVKFVSKKLS
jgi:DNA-binding LytR/AlgR family response regulator